MKRHIAHLRAKPEHVKRRIAFFTSFGITAIIFVFWATSFTLKITSDENTSADAVVKAESPGSVITASAKDAYDQLKNIFITIPNSPSNSNNK